MWTALAVAGLALPGWLVAPVPADAETPLPGEQALQLAVSAGTVERGDPGRKSAQDPDGWDGLVTLVVEYLDPTGGLGEATARVANTQEPPST